MLVTVSYLQGAQESTLRCMFLVKLCEQARGLKSVLEGCQSLRLWV